MGRDIPSSIFSKADFEEFRDRLRDETRILMTWLNEDAFEKTASGVCGFELEGWLVDENYKPSPTNDELLERVESPLVFHELSKFNFEINSAPHNIEGNLLSALESELVQTWSHCQCHAGEMGVNILATGILPTIKDEMMTMDNMSSCPRFFALNKQVLRLRKNEPVKIRIEGKDSLYVERHDIMMEAVSTSLQIHLQVNHLEAGRRFNTSQVLAAPMVAAGANSPFLFGKALWDETRIPTFEQAVPVASFRDSHGDQIGRVTFGTGYVRNSILELFLENLDGYPVLLPQIFDEDTNLLSHLRLHNGTIWRWNRPLIGHDDKGNPHIRIEHRVIAAGPSMTDVVANIALFLGLMNYYSNGDVPLDQEIPFETAKDNFYEAAKYGLNANVKWIGEKEVLLQLLLLESLLPNAREGLLKAGLTKRDVSYYIDDIMKNRISSKQNGAAWQRLSIEKHRGDFREMTHDYFENQRRNIPVYRWRV